MEKRKRKNRKKIRRKKKKKRREKEGIKKRIKVSSPMMYLQVIKEINHLLITYLAIIIDELIIKFTGEKQTGGQTLSWILRTLPKI